MKKMSNMNANNVHKPQAGGYYGKLMSKREFCHQTTHRKQLLHLHLCCLMFYFIVVMSVFLQNRIPNVLGKLFGVSEFLNLFQNIWVDHLIVILLVLVIEFTKSRIATSLLFAYTAIDCLYKYYTFHRIEGVWPLLVAGYMVTLAFELAKAYEQYKMTGIA